MASAWTCLLCAAFVIIALSTASVHCSTLVTESSRDIVTSRPIVTRRKLVSASGYIRKPTVFLTASGSSAEATIKKAITLASSNSSTVQVTLKSDVTLTAGFPAIGFSSGIYIKGECTGSNGKARWCALDGAKKFRIFSGAFACGISLEALVVQHALNGVHVGGCQFTARRCLFQDNVATTGGGAVLNSRDSSPTAGTPVQLTDCTFARNVAAAGDGGVLNVGRDPTGGPDVNVARCVFRGNAARAGSGGAIYAEGSTIYVRKSVFSQNTAAKNGGAIAASLPSSAAPSPQLSAIASQFTGNSAARGQGGALALSMQGTGGRALLCATAFQRNSAPRFATSDDVDAGTSSGALSVCGRGGPARVRKSNALRVDKSCTGCTGCSGDCNGKGTCVLDGDLNPYCRCRNHFAATSACTACSVGYSRQSQCAACAPGFYATAKGTCSICGGMSHIPDLVGESSNLNNVKAAASATACQQMCQTAQRAKGNYAQYCNLWAYVDAKNSQKQCQGRCLMFNDGTECGVRNVTTNRRRGVTYQFMEPSFLNCN